MRFEILEIPGSGAHATVCLARKVGHDEIVCLKVLQKAYAPTSEPAMRVRDEARLLERLDHPNIVALSERLEIEGRQVLVMEWVKGDQLHRLVRKRGRFPAAVAVAICRAVASAALYAYTLPEANGEPLRLVHRDLNLTNILLSVRGEVKVLDYGMARGDFEDRESETQVTLRGTAGYTAPEGLSFNTDKLDVYSLGICLLFLLTGHMPIFSKQKLSHDIRMSEVCTFLMEKVELDVDGDRLCDLIRGMCAYLPDERWSMELALKELTALLPADVDLVAFAESEVRPHHDDRTQVPPAEHPAYSELAFLESTGKGHSDGDRRLRKLLRQDRWYQRESEVKWMLVRNPDWTGAPLITYLERAQRPWWQLWMRLPPKEGVMAALRLLKFRPSDRSVKVCRSLSRHKDKEIAALAKELL